MIDFGESDKIIKIRGKVDKSNAYNGFNGNILFFSLSGIVLTWGFLIWELIFYLFILFIADFLSSS